jgi:hypothetical protein
VQIIGIDVAVSQGGVSTGPSSDKGKGMVAPSGPDDVEESSEDDVPL